MPYCTVRMDLFADFCQAIRAELKSNGFRNFSVLSDADLAIRYQGLMQRLVPDRPRRVLWSRSFTCPAEAREGLAKLSHLFVKGENINGHLSSSVRDLRYDDLLFNDWGIFHFHLGATYRKDGFCERTKHVLLAKITNDFVYFIDVRPHGFTNPTLWFQQDLLNVILESWPFLLESYRVRGFLSVNAVSESEHSRLRKARCNAAIQLRDGHSYFGAGGGYALNGTSIQAVTQSDWFRESLDKASRYILCDLSRALRLFFPGYKRWPSELRIRLLKLGGQIVVVADGSPSWMEIKPTEVVFYCLSEPEQARRATLGLPVDASV
ncbi:hypothetical protein [Stutzerimonas xanthomarina]|uniref:hypothetical protein n=1 Tax=Stutzerimonas xanthomarina TaxID=271420 RepID=UPI003AA7FFF1